MADCSDLAKLVYTLSRIEAKTPGINSVQTLSEALNTNHGLDFSIERLSQLIAEASTGRARELSEIAKQFPRITAEARGFQSTIDAIKNLETTIQEVQATGIASEKSVKVIKRSAQKAALVEKMNALRKELRNLPAEKAERINRRIKEMQETLDRNDFAVPIPKDKSPATKELVLLNEKQRDLSRKIRNRVDAARPTTVGSLLLEGGLLFKLGIAGRDLSAVGVQGGFSGLARPELAIGALEDMTKALKTEDGAREARRNVENRDNFVWYASGDRPLALGDWDGPLSAQDEQYMGTFNRSIAKLSSEKLGIAGEPVKRIAQLTHSTGRANVVFLNTLRANYFDFIAETYYNGELNTEKAGNINRLVNVLTGSGGLGVFEKASKELNAAFFSPRLMSSSVQQAAVLLPKAVVGEVLDLAGRPNNILGGKELRRFVGATYGRYMATNLTAMAMAASAGFEIETDPRSGAFGNITLPGNFQLNVFGNLRPAIVTIAQIAPFIGGVKKNSGKIAPTIGEGAFILDRPSNKVLKFLARKKSPVSTVITQLFDKRDFSGRNTTYAAILGNSIYPIDAQNYVESFTKSSNLPTGAAIAAAKILGISIQHYEITDPKPKSKRRAPGF